MTLPGILGLYFVSQIVLITIVVFVLRFVLERRLIENSIKEFKMYQPPDPPPSEITIVSYKPLGDKYKNEFQGLIQKKFGSGIRCFYSTDKSLMGGAIIKTKDIKIGHSLRERLAEGGIVKE